MLTIEPPYESLAVELHESLGMGFFSSQTRQFMQVLISERHAVIRSTCTQLPFFWSAMIRVVALLQSQVR